jgi:periplasmic divalent cation tolerance protein
MDFCQVQVAVGSRDAAMELSRSAVKGRLAACAQVVGPITSVYRWQGAVGEAEEWLVLLKTTAQKYAALEEFVTATHSYEVPEVICVPIAQGSQAYLDWVDRQV